MKKLILLLVLPMFISLNSNAQTPATAAPVNPNGPVVKWDKTVNDFGDIALGNPKTTEFKLTNTGKQPLIITDAKASCGCTTPKYSREPILPGKSTVISVTYNAASPGVFNKAVTVITNADPNPVQLLIKGNVLAPTEAKIK